MAAVSLWCFGKALPRGTALFSHLPLHGLQGCQFSHPENQVPGSSPWCQADQQARRQGSTHSAPSPLPLPTCSSTNVRSRWTSRPVSSEIFDCSSSCTSTGWKQLSPSCLQAQNCQRIILSVSLFYHSCFILSQPADSWLWIQAGSNTLLKSHILLITCFRCFPSLLQAASEQQNEDRAVSRTSKASSLQFHTYSSSTFKWAESQPSSSLTTFSATCTPILLAHIV